MTIPSRRSASSRWSSRGFAGNGGSPRPPGITQQSYAWFEANPATATLERLFTVLRLLDVEISLDQAAASTGAGKNAAPAARKPTRIVTKARNKVAW